jgi:hypothetical protein
MLGNAAIFAIVSMVLAIAGVVLYGLPFGQFYSRTLNDLSDEYPLLGIADFFTCKKPAVGNSGDPTIGVQRVHAVSIMAALAAALTALGSSFLSGIALLVTQLVFGGQVTNFWWITGWVMVSAEIVALGIFIWQARSGRVRQKALPSTSAWKFVRRMRKLIGPGTLRPYSGVVIAGSLVAIILATPSFAGVTSSHQARTQHSAKPQSSGPTFSGRSPGGSATPTPSGPYRLRRPKHRHHCRARDRTSGPAPTGSGRSSDAE